MPLFKVMGFFGVGGGRFRNGGEFCVGGGGGFRDSGGGFCNGSEFKAMTDFNVEVASFLVVMDFVVGGLRGGGSGFSIRK